MLIIIIIIIIIIILQGRKEYRIYSIEVRSVTKVTNPAPNMIK